MYYFETGSVNPYYNLAFEEYILRNHTEGNICILWQNDNTIVIGRNQNREEEINPAFVEEHAINVVRRSTGGGAVYHDLGNLNFSFITDLGDPTKATFDRFSTPVVNALRSLGLDAHISGRNDILIGEHKISGTAQCIVGERILYHGTLLFDSDLGVLSKALNAKPEKFISKSTKSVRSRVCNIRELLVSDMDIQQFWAYIREQLTGEDCSICTLTDEELSQVNSLMEEKYLSDEWNFGRSPEYELKNSQKFSGGILEIRAHCEKGIIKDIVFIGDFLSRKPVSDIETALCGCLFKKDEIYKVLSDFELFDYFGGIEASEILSLLF